MTLPRVRKPPKRLEQSSVASLPVTFSEPAPYLRKEYFGVLDNLISDLVSRFEQPGVTVYEDIESILLKAVAGSR